MHITSCRRVFHLCGVFVGMFFQSQSHAQLPAEASCRSEIEQSGRLDKNGPLSVYQAEDEKVLIEIKSEDLEKEFIFANYVDRGIPPYVGQYAEPKLITFRLNGKKIEIIQKDSVGFFEDEDTLSRTRALTMSDAVIASLKLHDCRPTDAYFAYIDQNALSNLSSDFLMTLYRGVSQISAEMKGWRTFSDNINFTTEHRLSGPARSRGGSSGPNFSIRIRHTFLQRPQETFASRKADSRIGYFTVRRKNLGDIDQTSSFRYIHKWRLTKKNPSEALSEPVNPIVFWIENTTPEKFRPYIKQGALAWNEAFRAAGFLNAIEVYEQPADADWEAGDISKNVIRWQVAHNRRGDIGVAPAIHDPVTGEILGADILLNYAGIGDFLDDWTRLSSENSPSQNQPVAFSALQRTDQSAQSSLGKISNTAPSKIEDLSARLEGSYLLASLVNEKQNTIRKPAQTTTVEKIHSPTTSEETSASLPIQNIAALETPDADVVSAAKELNVAERMVKEVIIQLTMHEVGHSLGLTHNFRGSRWRSMDEIYDREKTKGAISASVMDYLPINFSPVGIEQGDFANTRLGPYDIWAIEYGYSPELDEIKKNNLLKRATTPGHEFSAHVYGPDPYTLTNDLTITPVDYAKARLKFASDASRLASLSSAFKGQNQYFSLFQELRFMMLVAVDNITAQITPFTEGITQVDDDPSAHFRTVNSHSKAKQKDAIEALEKLVFTNDALLLSDEFLHRLGDNFNAAGALRMQAKRSIISQLTNERLLLLRHRAGENSDHYGPTELLFDIKHAVFGTDLLPFAHPSKDRRDQQIMFAIQLAGLVNDYSNVPGEGYRSQNYELSIVSAAARPVRDALLRELLIPTPWASSKVRAHRRELRAILQ